MKGLYVRAMQKCYIWARKAQKRWETKEKNRCSRKAKWRYTERERKDCAATYERAKRWPL